MAWSSVSSLLETFGDAVWRADALADAAGEGRTLPSQFAALDAHLPGGGWPVGALCEILQSQAGQGEWRLLLPALRSLTQTVVLVAPPYAPFGPGLAAQGFGVQQLLWVQADALAERLWAAEQALRCAGVGAVLLWLGPVRSDHLRRLHLTAQAHTKLLWVMRPLAAQDESSPAVLRLVVSTVGAGTAESAGVAGGSAAVGGFGSVGGSGAASAAGALAVQVHKRRGPPLAQALVLPARPAALAALLAVGTPFSGHQHALDRLAAAA